MRSFTLRRGAIILLASILASPLAAADPMQVTIDNFTFRPQILKVRAGTAVTFINHDDIPHSVVSETGRFRSRALDTDQTFTFSFAKPGEFAYFCGLHPHMKGEIVVAP